MKTLVRMALVAAIAAITIGAGQPRQNWLNTYSTDANGAHVIGNPAASVKLTEYLSYTCPHCAHFFKESDVALRVGYIQPGTVSVTISNVIRNPVDMTVAMLTECGDPRQFFRRHTTFLSTQDTWLSRAQDLGQSSMQRWYTGDEPSRMRAIAADLGLYGVTAQWGVSQSQADRCLADPKLRAKIAGQQERATKAGVESTPSFSFNGKLEADVHDWPTVQSELMKRIKPAMPAT